jgi:hypothetical protein
MVLKENCQVNQLVLVFVGDFNPVVVQPYWLATKGLIRETEGEGANIELIHNDLARFSLDWAEFQITRERFEIRTTQEPYFEAVKDIAIGTFKILAGTPIRSFGINHLRHYLLESTEQYYNLGNTLAPLKNWSDLLEDPRLLSVEIVTEKAKEGVKRIRIQPSDFEKLKGKPAFMMNLNDHYQIERNPNLQGSNPIELLSTNWSKSLEFANKAESHLEKIIRQ